MKRSVLFFVFVSLAIALKAQSDPVEEMFRKYSDKEGFTVVNISSKMLGMFENKDNENKDANNIINNLKSIRILSVEDSTLNKNINFYTELSKKLDLSVYEELMVVKEGRDITKFLIKQKGNEVSELLVIEGGPGGNSLISIRGNLNMKDIADLSRGLNIDQLKDLDKADKNKQK